MRLDFSSVSTMVRLSFVIAAVAGLGLAAPASAQSDPPTSNTPIDASSQNSGVAETSALASTSADTRAPSQRLPEPRFDDYGASSFIAPTDEELDRFIQAHRPPADPSSNNGASEPVSNRNSPASPNNSNGLSSELSSPTDDDGAQPARATDDRFD